METEFIAQLSMKSILSKILFIGLLLTNCLSGFAHDNNSPRKVDSFGGIACDDAMARLDLFAFELRKVPEAVAYIVVYPERGGLPGKYQSYMDFSRIHLELVQNVPADHIVTVRGEYRSELTTELWVVPRGSTSPVTPSTQEDPMFGKFDEDYADYSTSAGKQDLWTYDLCPLGAVYFGAFARRLRSNPKSIGRLIVHIESGKRPGRARIMAYLLRREMAKEQGIASDRIKIVYGKPRKLPTVELWIEPIEPPRKGT
jgi:hypothetical protein